jgi:hypothetical protein
VTPDKERPAGSNSRGPSVSDQLGSDRAEDSNATERQQRPHTADRIAELLTSGIVGVQLLTQLWDRFHTASRFDVFLGVAMATTLSEARIALADAEVKIADAQAEHEVALAHTNRDIALRERRG